MAPRSTWKGYLKLSLVSVPVKAYAASSSGGRAISLNQLHDSCHSRIRYKKVCPLHGEVSSDEIVSGYEYAKDQYVVIDPSELDQLRTESDRSIDVESFVASTAIDSVYLTGKSYYLLPDGPIGQKPYQLLRDAMADEQLQAVAWIVLSGREQVVRVRPVDDLLAMDVLEYKTQVKDPAGFRDELVDVNISDQEQQLTKQLMAALVKEKFDPAEYPDRYTERLTALIESKVEGKELVSPPPSAEPEVINLMEALRQSVEKAKPAATKAASKPPKKKAASAARKKSDAAEKKSSRRGKKSG